MINRLNQREARELLQENHMGRLGCIVEGNPYITPVNYYFEDDSAYIHSLPGLKVGAMRSNSRVCLQVDRIESNSHWKSVIAYGNFEEVESPPERTRILEQMLKLFPLMTPVESALAQTDGLPHIIVFRVRIDRLTALGES